MCTVGELIPKLAPVRYSFRYLNIQNPKIPVLTNLARIFWTSRPNYFTNNDVIHPMVLKYFKIRFKYYPDSRTKIYKNNSINKGCQISSPFFIFLFQMMYYYNSIIRWFWIIFLYIEDSYPRISRELLLIGQKRIWKGKNILSESNTFLHIKSKAIKMLPCKNFSTPLDLPLLVLNNN